MRIGILCHSGCGGSGRVATDLAIALARRGHLVHLFTRRRPFGWRSGSGVVVHSLLPEVDNCHNPTRLHIDWAAGEFESFLSGLTQACIEESIEILHFHYALPFALVMVQLRRRLRGAAPLLVGTLHGTDVTANGPAEKRRLAEALEVMDALTTVSWSHAGLAVDLLRLPVTPEVIPNFVDLKRFCPAAARSSRLDVQSSELPPWRRPRVIHLSNFRAIKNPLSVGRIFLLILSRIDAELWLVGDGEEIDQLRAMLRESGAEGAVRYWGLQADVAPYLAAADILLMTSLAESFCLVALEAMACGTPVLATRVGGLPEVVLDGETGYLFPAGAENLAADLAVALLCDPPSYRAMREASLARARVFEEERVVNLYEDLYQRLLARPRSPGFSALVRGGQRL